ncbi:MAG: M15 family metallopeptidase [Bacilli bacterium]|nr:M15 family metallopeptidase [Bacilli bacterium]
MARLRKIKLKRRLKRFILFSVLICILILMGYKAFLYYKYTTTDEYKLIDKGYEKDTVELFFDKLSDQNLEFIYEEDKIDYLKEIVKQEFFIEERFKEYLEFYKENGKKSFEDVVTLVNVGATKDWYEDAIITDISKNELVLVNKFYRLPEDYNPGVIKKFSSTYAYGEVSAEETCYNAFIEMATAAKKDGITLILTSGYRTYASQKAVYDDFKRKKGEDYADEYAARPGHSEHETGLALDIFTYNGLMETFKTTPTYAWLKEHAKEYGFIERYKEGEDYMTGYAPEAWHYRYVGVDVAMKMESMGMTYDEYYAFYIDR